MSGKKSTEQLLQEVIEQVTNDQPEPDVAEEAARRVWNRLAAESTSSGTSRLRGCADFQCLIPEYLAGSLGAARKLLFDDHTRECVACRGALRRARGLEAAVVRSSVQSERHLTGWGYGSIAAGVVLCLALLMYWTDLVPPFGSATAAIVDDLNGQAYKMSDAAVTPARVGEPILYKQRVRTALNSRAILRLNDQSIVEAAPRSEFFLTRGWRGETIHLRHGNVIVHAAQQGRKRLALVTDECRVEVQGTLFAVNHGLRGSRVSVLEGEVWVSDKQRRSVLRAGQQYSSNPALGQMSLKQEIGWSQNAGEYLGLMRDLAHLQSELRRSTFSEQLRYSSRLAGYLPAQTVVYGAFPNLSGRIDEAHQALQQRLQESEALRRWYEEQKIGPELDQMLEELKLFGTQLGPEIVVAVTNRGAEECDPLLIAEVKDPVALRQLIEQAAAKHSADDERPKFQIVDHPAKLTGGADDSAVHVLIYSGVVAVSPSSALLKEIAGYIDGSKPSTFTSTGFSQTIANSYREGVDWLVSVDFENAPFGEELEKEGEAFSNVLGVARMRDLVLQRKQNLGVTESRAVLRFNQTPEGVISWLAAPGPIGGLQFVSPDAQLAAAFVIKDPLKLVDDLFAFLQKSDPEAWQEFVSFQLSKGINFREDFAAPLGGEIVFAVDGPLLPQPSWKLVVEVNDPVRLQKAMEWLIQQYNQILSEKGVAPVQLEAPASAAAAYTLRFPDSAFSIQYTYTNGYLIAAPNLPLIMQAVQYQRAGYTLPASPKFRSLLPPDIRVNLSAVLYNNLLSSVEALLAGNLSSGAGEIQPVLAGLYSESDRLVVASTGDIESLWLQLPILFGLSEPSGLQSIIQQRSDRRIEMRAPTPIEIKKRYDRSRF